MPGNLQPSPPRFAVIDIGTNTFHLLIAEPAEGGAKLREIYRSRHFIKLAEQGIETLSSSALERGMKALRFFRRQLDEHGVPDERMIALGTAALRTAVNGPAFRMQVKEVTNIDIQIITGDREAELIAQGALLAIPPPREPILIMDIGGGSVEFIIADGIQVYWAQSFPVGVAVLYHRFHRTDPISADEIQALRDFLRQQLQPLKQALRIRPATHLIGAAGTFDVIADHLSPTDGGRSFAPIEISAYDRFFRAVLPSTIAERYAMPEIPDDRADMIVVALLLIDLLLAGAVFARLAARP